MDEIDAWLVEKVTDDLFYDSLTHELGVFDRPDAYEIIYMQTTPEVHDDMISSETLIIELPADDKPVDVIKLGADNSRSSKDASSRVR